MVASGIAMTMAMIAIFVRGVYFRKALREMPRARAMTRKNHSRIIILNLYFIRMKIKLKAIMSPIRVWKKFGCSSSGVSSPNGRGCSIVRVWDSPVVGSMIVCEVVV